MSRRGPTEGIVRIGQGRDAGEVFITGRKALNRAIHGDVVAGDLGFSSRCWSVAGTWSEFVCKDYYHHVK